MNILLSAVGRRPYLVRWFRQALAANGVPGKVIAADTDPYSPARAFANEFIVSPRVDDPAYPSWLSKQLTAHDVKMAISINDFELSEWATYPPTPEWGALIRASIDTQQFIEDKSAMSAALSTAGVVVPKTWIASEFPHDIADGPFVTKGRFGSGSRGLRFADAQELPGAIEDAVKEVTTRQGKPATWQDPTPPTELLVVQREISGAEFGLDVVCDLDGNFQTVLARRKISMRSGETDRAVSADPTAFVELARGIARVFAHPGLIDVDVIVQSDGELVVIDVNPRFGGGYPFSHLAGAHIPSAYVAWAHDLEVDEEWLRCDVGVTAGKFVEIIAVREDDAKTGPNNGFKTPPSVA